MKDAVTAIEFVKEWSALGVAAGALLVIFAGKGSLSALGRWRDGVLAAALYPFKGEERAKARFEKTEKLVEAILVELKTNGGSSLKDAINRIEDRQVFDSSLTHLLWSRADAPTAFMADHEGLYTWISPALATLAGRPLDEVRGRGWLSFVHADDAEHVREAWTLAVAGGWPFSTRFRILRPDGNAMRVHSTANAMIAGPRVIGWSGLITVEEHAP